MSFKIKKKFSYAIVVSFLGAVFSLAFVNMSVNNTSSSVLPALLEESKKVSEKLRDGSLSQAAQDIYRLHKLRVSNVIAIESAARTCSDLISLDPTTLTGSYILYPMCLQNPGVETSCVDPSTVISIINPILLDE